MILTIEARAAPCPLPVAARACAAAPHGPHIHMQVQTCPATI